MVFKILCILVLWMKVRRVKLALEELNWIKRVLHSAYVKYYRVLISPPQVESGKQSAYRFLKVLSSLREWEICSPDIMAAIEYCRDRIIDMTVEDYEEWFRQQFPKITRPQTAPPLTPVKLDKSSSSERVWIEKLQLGQKILFVISHFQVNISNLFNLHFNVNIFWVKYW